MILTDGIHIVSTEDVDELHNFARRAGIKRCWFDPNKNHPHYDKPQKVIIESVLNAGAFSCDGITGRMLMWIEPQYDILLKLEARRTA